MKTYWQLLAAALVIGCGDKDEDTGDTASSDTAEDTDDSGESGDTGDTAAE